MVDLDLSGRDRHRGVERGAGRLFATCGYHHLDRACDDRGIFAGGSALGRGGRGRVVIPGRTARGACAAILTQGEIGPRWRRGAQQANPAWCWIRIMTETATLAAAAKAWPFEQARLVIERLKKKPKDGPVIFETGYG